MRLLALLLACNGAGLNTGSDGGLSHPSDAGTQLPACSTIKDAASCDARDDCYALYSGDLPCDNTGCSNHFVSCQSGAPSCASTGVCNGSCTMLVPSCPSGLGNLFAGSCCSNGCSSKCAGPCTSDAECGAHAYCRGLLASCSSQCQLTIGLAATGSCHRSCDDDHCRCLDDSDCPGFFTTCDVSTGTCNSIQPPVCHAACPSGCADSSDVQYGEICICSACP